MGVEHGLVLLGCTLVRSLRGRVLPHSDCTGDAPVDCPICKSLLPETALICTQCGQPQTVDPGFLTRPKIPIWRPILGIVALVVIIKIGINHPINQKKTDGAQSGTPVGTALSHPLNINGTCSQTYGTPGQADFAVTTWHPRADGQCYTADEPAPTERGPPAQRRIFR